VVVTPETQSARNTPYFTFTGGTLEVEISIGDDVYVDLERDFHADSLEIDSTGLLVAAALPGRGCALI
jgi:hypothetical protein